MQHCIKECDLPGSFPPQHQQMQPGIEAEMRPLPIFDNPCYEGTGKLKGKTVLITGGDSGIGRAVSVAFAKEGAEIAIGYLNEQQDAEETREYVEGLGGTCILLPLDLRTEKNCSMLVEAAVRHFGKLDVLVNNAGVQFPRMNIEDVTEDQLKTTFQVNFFSMFYLVKAALRYMKEGAAIINTASVTAYEGKENLIDYSSTKGAVVSFTRSLSLSLASRGIRVNAVAPGPIWTPLIVSTFMPEEVAVFGQDVPMGRAGQPYELAPAYVYLASQDSSYMTGQVLHVNGGTITGS